MMCVHIVTIALSGSFLAIKKNEEWEGDEFDSACEM